MTADHIKKALFIDDEIFVGDDLREELLIHGIEMDHYDPASGKKKGSSSDHPDVIVCVGCDDRDAWIAEFIPDLLKIAPVMMIARKVLSGDKKKLIRILTRLFSTKGKIQSPESSGLLQSYDIDVLKKAMANGEFELWYQPIINQKSGFIIGFESLIRWIDPDTKEIIFPDRFMPTIESYDFIIPFGFWIIEEACKQLKEWQTRYPANPPIRVSINLSARQFTCAELCDRIIEIIDAQGIDPSTIALEITESAFMDDMEAANLMLLKLKAKHINIYLDDFGTGFASLSYLLHFPVDVIKVDKSFVKWMHVDEQSEEIVRSVISLAHNLKMSVVAEGVETAEHAEKLKEFGCDYLQGYHFSKPLHRDDAVRFLEAHLDPDSSVK
jgi:EAL domain-containing protein (putative c-di-GMP-specific phosphodiesterase class I)